MNDVLRFSHVISYSPNGDELLVCWLDYAGNEWPATYRRVVDYDARGRADVEHLTGQPSYGAHEFARRVLVDEEHDLELRRGDVVELPCPECHALTPIADDATPGTRVMCLHCEIDLLARRDIGGLRLEHLHEPLIDEQASAA